jgi:hypothetical protein
MWIEGAPWKSSPLLSPSCATPLLSLSPSLSISLVWLPKGLRRSEGDSIAARRIATGLPDQIQTGLLPQSRLDPRSERSHCSPYM